MALHFVHALHSVLPLLGTIIGLLFAIAIVLMIGARGVFRCADALYRQSEYQERVEGYITGKFSEQQRRREYALANAVRDERARREFLEDELHGLRARMVVLASDPNAEPVDDDTDDDTEDEE